VHSNCHHGYNHVVTLAANPNAQTNSKTNDITIKYYNYIYYKLPTLDDAFLKDKSLYVESEITQSKYLQTV